MALQSLSIQPSASALTLSTMLIALIALCPSEAHAKCTTDQSTIHARLDNDMFGGRGQDQGYTNGFLISVISPDLADPHNMDCVPDAIRRIDAHLQPFLPDRFEHRNVSVTIGQALFTPMDRSRSDLIADDRPYAAALLLGIGTSARSGDELRTWQIVLGVAGPAALGGKVQNEWHRVISKDRFEGWNNQLRNEPVFGLMHERSKRQFSGNSSNGLSWDLISHWDASVGNLYTHAGTGVEWRIGRNLSNDFGTDPTRESAQFGARLNADKSSNQAWAGHVFVTLNGRWVLRDMTLDGNTFRTSHRVDKRSFVADLGFGLVFAKGDWQFSIARYHRTREFDGQRDLPVYGTITISRRF